MIAEKSPTMRNAVQRLIDFSDDEEVARYRQERIRLAEMDERIALREARKEGRMEGIMKGQEEILDLIEKGFSVDEIRNIQAQKQQQRIWK
jgi:hypothetical protein